jgi:geranylgeranyl reductase family protein
MSGVGEWDVAVVGAGPAGCLAARSAALAGARTLLLERARLPRYKTCGGGLVGLSRGLVPMTLAPLEQDRVRRITITLDGRRRFTRSFPDPDGLIGLVMRDELDLALVEAAGRAGAEVRSEATVIGLAEADGWVSVTTPAGPVRARVVVGADGSAGRSSGHVGVVAAQVDVGLEGEFRLPRGHGSSWAGRVLIDWGPVPGSYGWVFPKQGTLTVGVIGDRGAGDAIRRYYAAFTRWLGLGAPVRFSGHLTRCRHPGSPLRRGGVLVVGDAAGLLEPLSREGISYALRSGSVAGRAAAAAAFARSDGDHEAEVAAFAAYERYVEQTLAPEMAAGAAALQAHLRRPAVVHGLLATPPGWRLFGRVVRGDASLANLLSTSTTLGRLPRLGWSGLPWHSGTSARACSDTGQAEDNVNTGPRGSGRVA